MLVSSLRPFLSTLSRQSSSGRLIRSFSAVPNLWIDRQSNVLGLVSLEDSLHLYSIDKLYNGSFMSQFKNKIDMNFTEAVDFLKPSAILLSGPNSATYIIESIKATIPLIVCSEDVDAQHIEGIKWHLKQSKKSFLIGPSSNGFFRPGHYRVSGTKMPKQAGKIGVVARSKMATAALGALTKADHAPSFYLDIGKSEYNGVNFIQVCQYLINDPATQGILLSGYLGLPAENELLEWLAQERRTNKPITVFLHHPPSIPLTDAVKAHIKKASDHQVRFTFHDSASTSHTAIGNFFSSI